MLGVPEVEVRPAMELMWFIKDALLFSSLYHVKCALLCIVPSVYVTVVGCLMFFKLMSYQHM